MEPETPRRGYTKSVLLRINADAVAILNQLAKLDRREPRDYMAIVLEQHAEINRTRLTQAA